jgi:hypothetical protein
MRCADKQPGPETRNIPAAASVEMLDGVGASPGYHIRTVASSDHLPRGEKPAPSPLFPPLDPQRVQRIGGLRPHGTLRMGDFGRKAQRLEEVRAGNG